MKIVSPAEMPTPKGYSHGVVACGKTLYISGQIGMDNHGQMSENFAEQFATALGHVVKVTHDGGATTNNLVAMTIYVTDMKCYKQHRQQLRTVWQACMGDYYPTMTLVEVSGLFEPDAQVEIQAIAVLPQEDTVKSS